MERIKKNFGFGFMRLPMQDGEVDIAETNRMVDAFLDAGFNYFDTAHGYLQGKSEKTLKTCLTSRYLRDRYILTDKLTENFFKTEADIRPLFESQLEACGVDYFDFYLMHSQCSENYGHFKACRAYETAFALKEEGKVRHVGISFHGRPELLEQILTEYPAIEVVQIQFRAASAMRSAGSSTSRSSSWSRSRVETLSSCRTMHAPFWMPCMAAARPAMPSASLRASPAC